MPPELVAVSAADTVLAAFAREMMLPRLFVHASALCGLAGCLSPNILILRMLSVMSSSFAMMFNLWNRLLSPVVWNLAFMTINISRIVQLLMRSGDITLSSDQQQLFELAFSRFGVTLREFVGLLEETGAAWLEYEAERDIVHMGDAMPLLHYVVDGEVEVVHGHDTTVYKTLSPGKGGWLGELWDPNEPVDYWDKPHHWKAGFRAKVHSRVVAFDRKRLHDFIARSPHMRDAAGKAEIADLWGKLRASTRQTTRAAYKAMLEMAQADGITTEDEASFLEHFAHAHPLDLPADVKRNLQGKMDEQREEAVG